MTTLSPLVATINVAVGGAAGAALRYHAGRAMTQWLGPQAVTTFPFATLMVNAFGSLLMGFLAGYLVRSGNPGDEQLRLLLGVGLLGGFTTFSAFSLEMVMMIQRGQYLFATLYAVLSFSLGLSGLMAGLAIMRVGS